MNVLIMGSGSMIARRLKSRLENRHRVYTADREGDCHLIIDLTSLLPESKTGLGPIDVMVNCAAAFGDDSPDGCISNEIVNSVGALRAGYLAAELGCRHIVNLTSIFGIELPDNEYFGSYGLSKRHGDENLAWLCRSQGIGFTSLMLGQVYDENGEARGHQPHLYHMIDKAKAGQDIVIYGSLDAMRNYIFVEDVAGAIEQAIEKQVYGGFPCVSPATYPISKIARMAFEVYQTAGDVIFDPDKPDLKTQHIPTDMSLYEKLSFMPQTDLRQGITLIKEAWRV